MNGKDMCCVRVRRIKAADAVSSERHNERKNLSYSNINVVPEMTGSNIHFRDPGGRTYMETLADLEKNGMLSRRGLRSDATLFDEIIIDVNTMYFERNGGYEYAARFYEEAYRFLEEKFRSEYIVSAVMHADELNKAATDELGHPTFHYHLHATVIPVVDKEILWSRRCKDPALRGTVKEVIRQISHSKKWASDEPVRDESGNAVYRSDGRPKYRPSYSVLQDEFAAHMKAAGYPDIERGVRGSTAEHLTSLQYQIGMDRTRLEQVENRIDSAEKEADALDEKIRAGALEYRQVERDRVDYYDIRSVYRKESPEGRISLARKDFDFVEGLAVESVTGRSVIRGQKRDLEDLRDRYNRLADRFNYITAVCRPFLIALRLAPEIIAPFKEKLLDALGIADLDRLRAYDETAEKLGPDGREQTDEFIR